MHVANDLNIVTYNTIILKCCSFNQKNMILSSIICFYTDIYHEFFKDSVARKPAIKFCNGLWRDKL